MFCLGSINYKEAYNLYPCNGILFNHESPIRGETFVTRKIIRGLIRIKNGYQRSFWATFTPKEIGVTPRLR